jgi:hypothetical protein
MVGLERGLLSVLDTPVIPKGSCLRLLWRSDMRRLLTRHSRAASCWSPLPGVRGRMDLGNLPHGDLMMGPILRMIWQYCRQSGAREIVFALSQAGRLTMPAVTPPRAPFDSPERNGPRNYWDGAG